MRYICVILMLLFVMGCTEDPFEVPVQLGIVTDNARLISHIVRVRLEQSLRDFREATGSKIAVCTVKSTGSIGPVEAAKRTMLKWQLCSGKKDDGILLFVVKDTKITCLIVGADLQKKLPEDLCAKLLEESEHYYVGPSSTGRQLEVLTWKLQEVLTNQKPLPLQNLEEARWTTADMLQFIIVVLCLLSFFIGFIILLRKEQQRDATRI